VFYRVLECAKYISTHIEVFFATNPFTGRINDKVFFLKLGKFAV